MGNFKKLIAVLTILFIFTVLSATAQATANIDILNATGETGDTVSVDIEVYGAPNVAGIEVHLAYTAQHLSFVQISSTVLTGMTTNDINSTSHIIWEDFANPIDATSSLVIATIQYEILPGLVDSTEITFMDSLQSEIADPIGDTYALTTSNGWVIYNQSTDVLSDGDKNILPDDYYLETNQPNPFNPVTKISFGLPTASDVTLEIYNIIGQKTATLVNKRLEAGKYSYIWDGGNSASGVYFYRLRAGEFTDAKKMILLK